MIDDTAIGNSLSKSCFVKTAAPVLPATCFAATVLRILMVKPKP